MTRHSLKTDARTQFVEITTEVREAVYESKVKEGLCLVSCPHTTAAITIQENADPDVVHDMLLWLNRHIPKDFPGFRHAEGNSDSHIKASLIGPGVTIPITKGDLAFGTWQGIYFCEFDGPRMRTFAVTILGTTT